MKTKIIVNTLFKQQDDDEILYIHPCFVEILTSNEEFHKDNILEFSEDELYNLKLEWCLKNRKLEYSKLNQFEMRFDDEINGTTNWIDTIKAIKEKYPKPEEVGK